MADTVAAVAIGRNEGARLTRWRITGRLEDAIEEASLNRTERNAPLRRRRLAASSSSSGE